MKSRTRKPAKLSWLQNIASRRILVLFEAVSALKWCSTVGPVSIMMQNIKFEIKHTYFLFRKNRNTDFLFFILVYSTFHSFFLYNIHVLSIFKFLVYHFHGTIDGLKKNMIPKFNPFLITVVIFVSVRLKEVC